jgi:hypothetical protein
MPKRKVINSKALLEMIKEGVPQSEIMEKFGFKNTTQLKVAYANALMDTGEVAEIKGKGRTKKKKPVNTKVTVNGRGSLIIPKVLIESMKIKVGQAFEVKKTASGIQLKIADKEK